MAGESTVPFKINMPSALRDRLGEASEQSGRSVTAEIVARLEKSFEADEEFTSAIENIDDLADRVRNLEDQMADVRYAIGNRDFR